MKTTMKALPILAGCLLYMGSGYAQNKKNEKDPKTPVESNFSLGVKGGIQTSSFSRFAPIHTRVGWNAGLTMTYSSWEHWGLGGDILYTRTGGYYSVDRAVDTRHTVHTDFVRLVPKVTYFFMDLEDPIRPKVFLGPNVGILTMAGDKNRGINLYDEYHPVEIGITVGTGFNWRLARAIWLNFDVEYLVGLNKINKVNTYNPNNLRTNSLSGSVGLAFGLNRIAGK